MLTCVIYNYIHLNGVYLSRVCHEDYRRRQVGECADAWYKQIQPTERVELLPPDNLPMHLCESETVLGDR